MKIDVQTSEVLSGGVQQVKKFTIKAGAHMMQVLSRLYKDPVEAMVREYMTNMNDAYIALRRKNPNAKIIPPILHLPTLLDSTLMFKDFGIGMSKETVMEVYTQYGNSTKNDSNDEVGGFGLGSKTAFAYNGGVSWSVESRFDGEKHIFMAFMGEDNVPTLAHVSSEKTTEPSGITIKIPIKRGDDARCYEAAKKYVPFFPMDIEVKGDQYKVEPKIEYVLRGKTWGIRKIASPHHRNYAGTNVIMGNVPYQLDWKALMVVDQYGYNNRHIWSSYGISDTMGELVTNNTIDFFVPIGSVNIVPSRDDLEYTDATKNYLRTLFLQMVADLEVEVGKMISSAKTEWDAITAFKNLNTVWGLTQAVAKVKWNGKDLNVKGYDVDLTALKKLDDKIEFSSYTVTHDRGVPTVNTEPKTMTVTPTNMDTLIESGKKLHRIDHEGRNVNYLFLLIDDLTKGGAMIAKALMYDKLVYRSHTGRLQSYGHTNGTALVLTTKLSEKELSEYFGGYPVKYILRTSALKTTINIPSQLKSPKDTIYKFTHGSWRARANIPDDTTNTIHYVILKRDLYSRRWTFNGTHHSDSRSAMATLRNTADMLKITVGDIYGVKEDELATFKDKTNWKDLTTVLADAVELKISEYADSVALNSLRSHFHSSETQFFLAFVREHRSIQKEPLWSDLFDAFKLTEMANNGEAEQFLEAASMLNLRDKLSEATEKAKKKLPDIMDILAKLRKKYPMMAFAEDVWHHQDYSSKIGVAQPHKVKPALDYIKSIG